MDKKHREEPQCRSLSLRGTGAKADVTTRTARFSFSSEEPIDMWYGKEILSHAPGCVRMGQRQTTMPLLFNHSRDDLIGVVENITIGADKRGYADVRFGKDERGEWAMQQYNDDVLVNVSFMYRVFKVIEDSESDTETAIDWEPYEISLVTVPADASVGKGRALDHESRSQSAIPAAPASAATLTTGDNDMKRHQIKQDTATDGTTGATGGTADQNALRAEAAVSERQRGLEIEALCQAHNIDAEVRRGLIQKGASIAEARGAVLDIVLQRDKQNAVASLGNGHAPDLSEKEKASYSLTRAINAAISGDWKAAGFELEVSSDIAKRMGKSTQGFFMPTNIPFAEKRAAYAAGATATGGALVATNLLAGSFIEILRNKSRVMQLGATVLSGLVGNVDIPRQNGASSTFWVTEGTALTEAEATFDKVSLAMKHIGTYSQISRNMLMQSTPDIEMLVRADLIAQIALGIDLAALSGAGSGGVPLGISNTSGIGSVVGGTNGAAITIDHLIDLETSIAAANADVDNMAYIANAKTVGALKKLKSTTGQYLWTNNPIGQRSSTPGEINGYTVARTNQARSTLTKGTSSGVCSEIFMGNFSELLIGEWGVLEIMPNPYDSTAYKAGAILIRAMQSVDVGVRHAASFAVMSDALTA